MQPLTSRRSPQCLPPGARGWAISVPSTHESPHFQRRQEREQAANPAHTRAITTSAGCTLATANRCRSEPHNDIGGAGDMPVYRIYGTWAGAGAGAATAGAGAGCWGGGTAAALRAAPPSGASMGSRWASVVNTYFRRDTGWSGDCNMYKYLQQQRNKRDLCQVLRILTAGITHSSAV